MVAFAKPAVDPIDTWYGVIASSLDPDLVTEEEARSALADILGAADQRNIRFLNKDTMLSRVTGRVTDLRERDRKRTEREASALRHHEEMTAASARCKTELARQIETAPDEEDVFYFIGDGEEFPVIAITPAICAAAQETAAAMAPISHQEWLEQWCVQSERFRVAQTEARLRREKLNEERGRKIGALLQKERSNAAEPLRHRIAELVARMTKD